MDIRVPWNRWPPKVKLIFTMVYLYEKFCIRKIFFFSVSKDIIWLSKHFKFVVSINPTTLYIYTFYVYLNTSFLFEMFSCLKFHSGEYLCSPKSFLHIDLSRHLNSWEGEGSESYTVNFYVEFLGHHPDFL